MMTQNKSKFARSVWSLTLESVPADSSDRVVFDLEAVKKIPADIRAKAAREERFSEQELNVGALRTLFV